MLCRDWDAAPRPCHLSSPLNHPISPPPFPTQSPPSERSSVHPLEGSLGGFGWEAQGEPRCSEGTPLQSHPRLTAGSPLAAGLAVPGDAGSGPTPPPPEIPREQSHRATRHSVHARARVLTATDSGLTLKVWLAPPPLPGSPGRHARHPAAPSYSREPVPVLQALLSTSNGRTKWFGPMATAKVARAVEPIKVQLYVSPAPETLGAGR